VIVVGSSLTGIFTELAQYIHETNRANRLAIVSNYPIDHASWVAGCLGTEVGVTVGFSLPFQNVTTSQTQIKFLNVDMLLQEALRDPLLRQYSVIIVEDVHLRLTLIDIVLGVLKKVLRVRPSLKLVMTSAPDDDEIETISEFFGGCSVVSIDESLTGSQVDVLYTRESTGDYVHTAVRTVLEIRERKEAGTIAVVFASNNEVSRALKMFKEHNLTVLPYISPKELETVDDDSVILTTGHYDNDLNLLARGNIRFVVDCGFDSMKWFDAQKHTNAVLIHPISKAQATRRRFMAGHSGRTGKCFRLYTEQAAVSILTDRGHAEICGTDLTDVVLGLKALGVDNVARSFPFVTAPSPESIASAFSNLFWLGAVDDMGKLTSLGEKMAQLAVRLLPLRRAIVVAGDNNLGCLDEMISIAAMVSAGGMRAVLMKTDQAKTENTKFYAKEGDYLTLLNIFSAFRNQRGNPRKWARSHGFHGDVLVHAEAIRSLLQTYVEIIGINRSLSAGHESLPRRLMSCVATSFFLQVAKRTGEYYEIMTGPTNEPVLVKPDANSVFAEFTNAASVWVVYDELVEEPDGAVYMNGVNQVERAWLEETKYYKAVRLT
jgi:ATP-dependent RNA helicase DDX35